MSYGLVISYPLSYPLSKICHNSVANRSVVRRMALPSWDRDRAGRLNGTTEPACSRLLKEIAFARVGRPDDDSISPGASNEPHQGAYARRRPPPIPSTDIVAFGSQCHHSLASEPRSIRWLSFLWQPTRAPLVAMPYVAIYLLEQLFIWAQLVRKERLSR